MSVWNRRGWQGGFPFSPTRLVPQGRGIRGQGGQIDVTAPGIADAVAVIPGAPVPLPAGRPAPPEVSRARFDGPGRMAPRVADLRLLPLGAFRWGGPGARPLPRTRSDHVLIWVSAGRLQLDLPGDAQVLQANALRLVPAGTAFATRPHPGAQGQVLLIAPSMVAGIDPPFPDRLLAGAVGRGAAMLSATLAELAAEAARGADRRTLACHLTVLSLHLSRLDAPRDAPCAPHPDRLLVDAFLDLAIAHLGSDLTLADLAQRMGTTLAVLDHACLAARGRRALDLLHGVRLDRAALLLRETDMAPAVIAQAVGYAGHAHMARAFAQSMGRTPDTYRAQMRDRA